MQTVAKLADRKTLCATERASDATEQRVVPGQIERHQTRRRRELEAKLLAHRCGWLDLDEVTVGRLERELRPLLGDV